MKTLQIGVGWFPEESGGLNRYYYGSSHHLPKAGVDIQGLVTGSEEIVNSTPPVKDGACTEGTQHKRSLRKYYFSTN